MLQHLIRLIGRYKIILTMYLIVIWFSRIIPDNFLQPVVPNFVFVSKINDWSCFYSKKIRGDLFGIETTRKLGTPLFVTNMKMVA